MTNTEFCKYVEEMSVKTTYADFLTEKRWGQTSGGYLDKSSKIETQKEHFLSYYKNKGKNEQKNKEKITYQYLRCPQLIIFIAEIVGVPCKNIFSATRVVCKYEKSYNGVKNGNYIWGHEEFRLFKNELKFCEVVKIIKENENIDEVKNEVKELFGKNNSKTANVSLE